jgi:hypothetical protein
VNTDPVCLPGPLHPDLFDGETPVMLPVKRPPKLYRVEVIYLIPEAETCTVAAQNEQEAMSHALADVKSDTDGHSYEVVDVKPLSREPSEEQLRAWSARKGAHNADV